MFTFNTSFISINDDTVEFFYLNWTEQMWKQKVSIPTLITTPTICYLRQPLLSCSQFASTKQDFLFFFFFLPILWNVQSSIICGSIYNNTSADQINKKGIESKGNGEIKQNEILQHENEIVVILLLRDRYFGYLINFVLPSLFRRALP